MEVRELVTGADLRRRLGSWQGVGPGYASLAAAMRSLVLDGRLPVRARLPSERELAAALGVSRTTTAAAYDLLREEGFVESRQGSGSRVALPTGGAVDRELGAVPSAAGDAIDLTIAALPAPGATLEALAAATRDLAGHLGGTGYEPRGLPSFRRAVAERFEARGVPTDPDQIVVTSGAQHALALLLDVLVAPGDPVLVEVPTYPNALEAMRRGGVRFLPAPMSDDGWDVETMAARFREGVPRLAYLIPDFQNPTGFLMDDAGRGALVAAASRAGTHLVVDETFAELDLEPQRGMPAPMAAEDDGIITIGSMSKAFWGGLRVGWIRCVEPLARRLSAARAAFDLASPALGQLVAQHLMGASAAVLAERRALLTERRDGLVSALARELPGWRARVPRGGLCLWAELERGEAEALAEAAEAEGVRIVPGPTFGLGGTLGRRVRLPFTQPPDRLEEAIVRLAAAQRRLRAGAPSPTTRWIA